MQTLAAFFELAFVGHLLQQPFQRDPRPAFDPEGFGNFALADFGGLAGHKFVYGLARRQILGACHVMRGFAAFVLSRRAGLQRVQRQIIIGVSRFVVNSDGG